MQQAQSTPDCGRPVAVTVLHDFRLPACGRGAPAQDLLELSAEAPPFRVRLLARLVKETTGSPRVILVPPMLRHAAAFELTDRALAAAVYAEAERVALDHFAAMGRIVGTLLGERLAAEPDGARRVAA